jgi:hypothetical protein
MSWISDVIQREFEQIHPLPSTLEARTARQLQEVNPSTIDVELEKVLNFINFLTLPINCLDFLSLKLACMNLLAKFQKNSDPAPLVAASSHPFSGEIYPSELSPTTLITAISVLGLVNQHEQQLITNKVNPRDFLINYQDHFYLQNPQLSSGNISTDLNQFFHIFSQWKYDGLTTLLAKGFFDLLHDGHVTGLEFPHLFAGTFSAMGVVVDSDINAKILKGPDRPVNIQDERVRVVQGLNTVNRVYEDRNMFSLLKAVSSETLFNNIKDSYMPEYMQLLDIYWRHLYSVCLPNIIVVGPDHKDLLDIEHSRAAPHGLMTVHFPYAFRNSDTDIFHRIQSPS